MLRKVLLCLLAIGMTGCGGGSGNNDSISTPPPSAGPELVFFGDETVTSGDSVGIAVTTSTGERISSIEWRTNSAVTLLAAHTQAIGFDALEVGNIVFDVEATLASGESLSTTYTVTVTSGESPKLNTKYHLALRRVNAWRTLLKNFNMAIVNGTTYYIF